MKNEIIPGSWVAQHKAQKVATKYSEWPQKPQRNELSKLPIELRVEICEYLSLNDLCSLVLLDRACHEAASPTLNHRWVTHFELSHAWPNPKPSPTWNSVRYLWIVMTFSQPALTEVEMAKLSLLWEYLGGNNPVRERCEITIWIQTLGCRMPQMTDFVSALSALTGFKEIDIRLRDSVPHSHLWDSTLVARLLAEVLRPGLGVGKVYKSDKKSPSGVEIKFFPRRSSMEDSFDAGYDHAMLAVWKKFWA